MSAIKLALQQNQKRDRRKTPEAKSADVSPDSKCPICLDVFNNIAYLDICLHKFCFRCIQEWSKNKAECPLCKQPFNSIYHSIKSEQDFKQYDLKPVSNGSFGTFGGVRFRYRTTLTGVQRQQQQQRLQQQFWGRTSPPPDNGVLFEATADTPPRQRQTRYVRRMMTRMAAKRRAATEGRMQQNVPELEMVNFRRELYRQGLRVRNVRDGGRCRDSSAEFYRKNPACLHRLIPWLKRELVVLYGAHGSLVNIVQHIIMSRITSVDMEAAAIQEELRPFLQGRTEHFLHEFISFAKSPFNMEAYDRHAAYEGSARSSDSNVSTNSSVIAISEDEDSDHPPTPGYAASNLSHSLWDDETPGPSYSTTAEPGGRTGRESLRHSDSDSSVEEGPHAIRVSPPARGNATHIQIDDGSSSDNDDCVIVGFVKPSAERTPELVQLSSDDYWSDDAKEAPPSARQIRFSVNGPAASPDGESMDADSPPLPETKERVAVLKSKITAATDSNRKDKGGRERSGRKHGSKDHKRKRERRRRTPSPESDHVRERDCFYLDYRSWKSYSKPRRKERQSYRKQSDRRSRSRSSSREPRRRESWNSRSTTCSSSPSTRRSHHDKPGGKRKYKTRHLENPPSPKDYEDHARNGEDGKEERSPSVRSKRHKRKKKKHKKKSRRHRMEEKRTPTPITINSDSADDTRTENSIKDTPPVIDAADEC
ncbi:topoisomerase I binding, arginine/serine-rich a [Stigmatopora argus]